MFKDIKETAFDEQTNTKISAGKKKSLDGLNIKMAMTERASELEDRPIELVQSEEQRGRMISKK